MNYKSFPTWTSKGYNKETITDEQIVEWKQEVDEIVAYNKQVYAQLREKQKELIKQAVEIWGQGSKVVNYLARSVVPRPNDPDFNYSVVRPVKEYREKLAIAERERKASSERWKYLQGAIKYLESHGKVLGEDFAIENAVKEAEHLAFELAVKSMVGEGDYYDFNGQNCDGPCEGWDGESRRCECGNRRVEWVRDWGFRYDNPVIYGEAY